MLLVYSDMLHSPIAAADIAEKVGSIADIIVEPEEHRVIAFVIHEGGWLGANKFLSPDDVIEYDPHALVVASSDALVPQNEIVRAEKYMKNRVHVIKRKVVSESGAKLGTVVNFAIDTETAGIVRYYVQSLFGGERIIPTKSVVAVTKNSLVVRENEKPARSRGVPKIAEG